MQPEARLEELLADVKLRTPATREHVLDSLWRWESMGGGELVATLPAPTSCDGGPGCEGPCCVQRPAAWCALPPACRLHGWARASE